MNIAILNMSGNVGKSTLAVHLVASNLENSKIISVESVNASDVNNVKNVEVEEITASNFKDIFMELMSGQNNIILDVGASNVVQFMSEMKKFKSSIREIDLIIVPVVPIRKQMDDTIATLEWLAERGFDSEKIRVVFNGFRNEGVAFEDQYDQLLGYLEAHPNAAKVKPYIILDENDIYTSTQRTGKTIKALADDQTDWRSKRLEAAGAGDISGVDEAMSAQMDKDLADLAQEQLADAWKKLVGKKK